jgi:hypothetical protein
VLLRDGLELGDYLRVRHKRFEATEHSRGP